MASIVGTRVRPVIRGAVCAALSLALLLPSSALGSSAAGPVAVGGGPAEAAEGLSLAIEISPTAPTVADSYIDVTVTATPTPTDPSGIVGTVIILDAATGAYITQAPYPSGATSATARINGYPFRDLGMHTISARLERPDTPWTWSDDLTFTITAAPTTTSLTGPATWAAHRSFQIAAQTQGRSAGPGGSIRYVRIGSPEPICDVVVLPLPHSPTTCDIDGLDPGTYAFQAIFSGTDYLLPSTSSPLVVTVSPETLDAGNVRVQYSTFYPVKDGYRDTVAISGYRLEPISVSIRIYNASNVLVRKAEIGVGEHDYSYPWNGRNSAGSVLAEGKYRVVQTLRDTYGTTKSFTSYVTLSRKRLLYRSTTITRYPSNVNFAEGYLATPTVTSSYVKLSVRAGGHAQAGWDVRLPSAVVYPSIKMRVYARHRTTTAGPTWLGAANFPACGNYRGGPWRIECFDRLRTVGNTTGTTAWFTTGKLAVGNRAGRTVRGQVVSYAGTTYIYKFQVLVTYGILGY